MSKLQLVLLGGLGGFVLAKLLINPSSCCATIQGLVSSKIGSSLGPVAQQIADGLGLTSLAPGILGPVYS